MNHLSIILLLAGFLQGCGATYTKFDAPTSDKVSAVDAECPNGIKYKTGRCRSGSLQDASMVRFDVEWDSVLLSLNVLGVNHGLSRRQQSYSCRQSRR